MATIMASLAVAACGSGSGPHGADFNPAALTISFEPATNQAGACTPKRTTVAFRQSGLYKVENRMSYSAPGQQPTRIPGQAVFRGGDPDTGLSRDRETAGLNFDAPCEAVTIRMHDFECFNARREAVACPPIELRGTQGFAGVETG